MYIRRSVCCWWYFLFGVQLAPNTTTNPQPERFDFGCNASQPELVCVLLLYSFERCFVQRQRAYRSFNFSGVSFTFASVGYLNPPSCTPMSCNSVTQYLVEVHIILWQEQRFCELFSLFFSTSPFVVLQIFVFFVPLAKEVLTTLAVLPVVGCHVSLYVFSSSFALALKVSSIY